MQGVGFLADLVRFQNVHHGLHGLGDGVVPGKTVALEQGIKNRLGDEVLGQHLDDFVIADAVVQVMAQVGGKSGKGRLLLPVVRVLQDSPDAVDVSVGNFGNVIGPVFPVVAVADFLDQSGVNGPFDLANLELYFLLHRIRRHGRRFTNPMTAPPGWTARLGDFVLGFGRLPLDFVGDGDDFHLARVTTNQIQFVDHGIKPVIVGA
ncbi:hypothetical protein FEMY_20990 [Ferrovum myxofaciens]|uniref:Uncharacterized protein n=1 Tax=Ferrovum myxofaciens TaxID=416213 RepID=A0A149VVX6_9PROT|nr:hypothetical protein FEMY_20990 [Ferrovum myxofaciens]